MPLLTPPLHTALREAVAARFGQPLRYPSDCHALEADMHQARVISEGVNALSVNTLRRFFGLVKKEGGYHLHTLDALARYAGHADFAAFGQAVARQAGATAPGHGVTDIPELLAMERLAYPERLLLGYFLGRVTRPATPDAPAAPLALRLAAHPAGQEFFVESFVDLAYLNGAYGEVLTTYLQHKHTAEAQLFGHCALFLGAFLAEDEAGWRLRLRQLRALPVPAATHAFPQGRRAFAEIVAAWHDAPTQPLPAALLARLRQEAGAVPRSPAPVPALPAFYNPFPAGYHFLVAEALLLAGQVAALGDWCRFTNAEFPELAGLEHNIYNELLRAFAAVAALYAGGAGSAANTQKLFALETHSWLLEYYQVHLWLCELHFAHANQAHVPQADELLRKIQTFADHYRMPFFRRVAARVPLLQQFRGQYTAAK